MNMQLRVAGLSSTFLLVVLALAARAAPSVVFRTSPAFPVGDGPAQVVVADFNLDQRADMATANADDGTVTILLGQENGTFAPGRHYLVGTYPDSLVVGDFDQNDTLDIVTANGNGWNQPGSLSFLPGRGDGTFGTAITFAVGRGPRGVVAADFNGDTHLDLAAAISGGWFETNQIDVLFGRGDGTFDAPAAYHVGTAPAWITAADFNGDRRADLAVVNAGPGTGGATVSVLINSGVGSFGPAATYPVGTYPGFIIAADLNQDNQPDLITANRASSSVSLLLGRADGTFDSAVNLPVAGGVSQLVAGCFDADANPDLAVLGGSYDSGMVTVLSGSGNGLFGPPTPYSIGAGLTCIAAGELTGDAKPDLAVAGAYDNAVLLMPGKGDGTFKNATDAYPVSGAINGIITGDLNQDSQVDVVTVNSSGNNIHVLLQQTNGLFLSAVQYAVGPQPKSVKAGDFNNDGFVDLAVASFDGSLTLLRGQPAAPGVFTNNWNNGFWGTVEIGGNHTDLEIGNFSCDDHLDIVTPNYYGACLSIALGDGTGRFHDPLPPVVPVNSGPTSVVVDDFNGDGKADLAVGYESGTKISLVTGRGDGTFDPKTDISTWEIPWFIKSADINFDGKPDLVAAHYDWRRISVMLNRTTAGGPVQFDPPLMHDVANDPVSIAVGDFNGDNLPDIVSGNYASLSVLLGNGDGTFLSATNFFVGGKYAGVADFNQDGMPDIAIDLGNKVGFFWNDTLPQLHISLTAGGVRIAWPGWNRYYLESSTNLLNPDSWVSLCTEPTVYGNQFVLTNSVQFSGQAFRLKRF
ncbi:MAG: VCBS repeat-containing protein [bacterium]